MTVQTPLGTPTPKDDTKDDHAHCGFYGEPRRATGTPAEKPVRVVRFEELTAN